jgi:hypothetical protein
MERITFTEGAKDLFEGHCCDFIRAKDAIIMLSDEEVSLIQLSG